jgi:VanZ family protein
LIFGFSQQDGETSGNLSHYLSETCVELVNTVTGQHWTQEMREGLTAYWEHPIRKLAHFGEYAIMGFLVYNLLSSLLPTSRKKIPLTVLWVFLSASADEFHQFFIPDRTASVADVLLDTCGGVFGLCLTLFGIRFFMHRISLRSKDGSRLG